MSSTAAQMRAYRGPAFFSFGFRPFFLCGALVASLLPFFTGLVLAGIFPFDYALGIIGWHGHEMLYGYLAAIVAGFILTAVPNWTGRLPMMGWRLAALFSLWLAGRAVMLLSPGAIYSAVIDSAFLLLMAAFMWREVIAGKNWRNAPVCALMTLFGLGNIFWHFDVVNDGAGGFGLRWGVAVIAVLLALIGGRVTPSFTRNWLAKTDRSVIDASFRPLDKIAIGALAVSLIAWLAAPAHGAAGMMLIVASLLHVARLFRWQGVADNRGAARDDFACRVFMACRRFVPAGRFGDPSCNCCSVDRNSCAHGRRRRRDDAGGDDASDPWAYGTRLIG